MENTRNRYIREENGYNTTVEGWLDEGYGDLFNNGPTVDLDMNHFPVTPVDICLEPPQVETGGSISTTPVYSPYAGKVVDVYNVLRGRSLESGSKKEIAFALGRQINFGGFSQIHTAAVLYPYIKKDDDDTSLQDVMWEVTDEQVAIKIIADEIDDQRLNEHLINHGTQLVATYDNIGIDPLDEISAIFMLTKEYDGKSKENHVISSIVTFLDSFPQFKYMFLVMPLCKGGELLEHVQSQNFMCEDEARLLFIQILQGLSQCHRLGIAHMDLSLENVLLKKKIKKQFKTSDKEEDPHLYIIDFGACILVPTTKSLGTIILGEEKENLSSAEDENDSFEDKHKSFDDSTTNAIEMINITPNATGKRLLLNPTNEGGRKIVGKLQYTCPELLIGNMPWDGFAADLWSCAIMLFIMLTGREPWKLAKESDFYYSLVQKDGFAKLLSIWGILECPSKDALDLLERMLHHNPNERLTRWKDIGDHPWIRGELQLDYT